NCAQTVPDAEPDLAAVAIARCAHETLRRRAGSDNILGLRRRRVGMYSELIEMADHARPGLSAARRRGRSPSTGQYRPTVSPAVWRERCDAAGCVRHFF